MNNIYTQITLSKQLNNIWIDLEVDVDRDFKPNEYNFGRISIESIYTHNQEKCNWDNLDFFFENSKSEIKKECKEELVKKGLHCKGIFTAIKELVEEARRLNLYYEGKKS